MPSSYYHTEALILKKMPFGEADFLVRALTKDFGKLDILAKGARKAHAKLNAHLDMLNVVRVSFVQNGERIPTLIDAERIAAYDDWFSDMEHMEVAGKMLRTIDLMIPQGSPDPELFSFVSHAFEAAPTGQLAEYGIGFLRRVLSHEGYGDTFDPDALPGELTQSILEIWPALKN